MAQPLRAIRDLITSQQGILILFLLIESAIFCFTGQNFATVGNGFELLRLSVEIGLLAVAITPVIITGGIDLSVGSLLGLSAVIFGKLWRDAELPIPVAALCTCLVGTLCGLFNGLLVTRFRIPPLIVTLGTFSLFRGLAEGITQGIDNFVGFPESFLALGNGYYFNTIPAQLPIFILVAVAFWILLHRTTIGRAWVAIGFSPEAARYSGIPVNRRLQLAYLLSGLTASLASIVYVARLSQAKADAGTNYELLAITAVVLGGTSIFGGRGRPRHPARPSSPSCKMASARQTILRSSPVFSPDSFIAAIGLHQWNVHRTGLHRQSSSPPTEPASWKTFLATLLACFALTTLGCPQPANQSQLNAHSISRS
ncbi:MAG: ABC transporter permease [Planctomycetales bacterium]